MDALRSAPARAIRHSARRAEHHAAAQAGAAVVGREFHDHAGTVRLVAGAVAQRHRIRRGPLREAPAERADGVFVADRVLVFEHAFRRQLGVPGLDGGGRPHVAVLGQLRAHQLRQQPETVAGAQPGLVARGGDVAFLQGGEQQLGQVDLFVPAFLAFFEVDREGGDVARIAGADAGRGAAEEAMSWRVLDGVKETESASARRGARRAASVIAVLP